MSTTTVIVSSAIANKPSNGGNALVVLNWVLGFQELGYRVLFLEQIVPTACVDGAGHRTSFGESVNRAYFERVMRQAGLVGASGLIYDGGAEIAGLSAGQIVDIAKDTAVLINITGHLTWDPVLSRVPCKVYVDLDPGYTQFWHAQGADMGLAGHDLFYTVGENIGSPDCSIPTGDIRWKPIRQPVVLNRCPPEPIGTLDCFTTVASWRGAYGRVEHNGHLFGQKAHEFRKVLTLPELVPQHFELALDIDPGDVRDLEALHAHEWIIVEPRVVAAGPEDFDRYVRGSGAEFSCAQGVYVETHSGWFSDRSVHYLACGKPVLVQDTGLGCRFPVGEGLLTFRSLEQAVAGVQDLVADYQRHCRAARALAEAYFDANLVLGELARQLGLAPNVGDGGVRL